MKKKHLALSPTWTRRLWTAAAGALAALMLPSLSGLAAPEKSFIPRAGSIPVKEGCFSTESPFNEDGEAPAGCRYFRIPALTTLENGDLLATADARWDTTEDGGGLDTIASVSSDGGRTWQYSFPFFFPDSDGYAGKDATTIIDPAILTGPDGTVYCFADVNPTGSTTLYKTIGTGTGYVTVNGKRRLALTMEYKNVDTEPTDNDLTTYPYYVGDFDKNGYAKILSRSDHSETGYGVDEWYNLYTTDKSGNFIDNLKQKQVNNSEVEIQQNAFYRDSKFHVYSIGYIWVVTSKDNGRTWEHPRNINDQVKRRSGEHAILVSPGKGITTSSGDMVIGCYDHGGAGNEENASIIYSSDNGETWKRTNDVPGSGDGGFWTSENEVVELEDGTLRMFFRNGNKRISYSDAVKDPKTGEYVMQKPVKTEQSVFSGCNVTALSYSKKIDGKQVILVACPTNGSRRSDGKIFTYLVEKDKSMTLFGEFEIPQKRNTLYNYSCLTELPDGSVGLLWESYWNHILYDTFSILDICPAADFSGATVALELERGERYSRSYKGKGNITAQPDSSIASLTAADGTVSITGTGAGFTQAAVDGVLYRILVKDSTAVTLNEGDSYELPGAALESDPTNASVLSAETIDTKVTGMFDHVADKASSLESFSTTANKALRPEDALFTFIRSGEYWQLKNENTNNYLVNINAAHTFFSAQPADMKITQAEDGTFRICRSDGKRYVIFYYKGMNFNANTDFAENYADGDYNLTLLEKSQEGAGDEILPGYVKATELKENGQYLISYIWKDGSVAVLYPDNGPDRQTKLASRACKGVRVTGKAPGSSQLTTGGKTYTFTVSDKKCSHSSTVLKYMIPLDCTHKGYTGITVCSDCGCVVRTGYELDPMGHSWQEGTVTKEAVNSENGCISFGCHHNPLHTRTETIYAAAYRDFQEAYKTASEAANDRLSYTPDSFRPLEVAYGEATKIIAAKGASRPVLMRTAAALRAAQKGLVLHGIVPPSQPETEPGNKPGSKPEDRPEALLQTGDTKLQGNLKFQVVNAAAGKISLVKATDKHLTKVTVPASVTINGVSCSVTQISPKAFKGCSRLKQAVIGKNVARIGSQAFQGCKKLSKITVKGTGLKIVKADAFRKTAARVTVKAPKNLKKKQCTLLLRKMKKAGMSGKSVIR